MRRYIFALAAGVIVLLFAIPFAMSHWQEEDGHKMHYPQLPDEAGWDVNATAPLVLADDFLCTETGWITDIHFWGSWKNGHTGTITSFVLSLHADIPADPPEILYSRPGPTLWEITISDTGFSAVHIPPKDPPVAEGWYDPLLGQYNHPDHCEYFQYNVFLDKDDWFWQEKGTIYWLNISATVAPGEPQPVWGWKSTPAPLQWNDDAVWAEWGDLAWIEMHNPLEPTESLDLSFVINGPGLDYGDAPDPGYPTLLVNNGARHAISAGYFLGACVDAEQDGQPDPNATGDDLAGIDDEDGVVFASKLIQGKPANVTVTASAAGVLDAWIDFNNDGDWDEADEQVFTSLPLAPGANHLSFNVPASSLPATQTFARFRFSSTGGLSYTGLASDGEVEDYKVEIKRPPCLPFLLLLD